MPRMLRYRLARKSATGILLLTRQERTTLAGSYSIVFRFARATARLDGLVTQASVLGAKPDTEPPEEF